MGQYLVENFKEAREVFEEASDAIKLDLQKLCFTATDEELALTKNTQPALLVVSVATYRVLYQLTGFTAAAGAGHSIGEYAALVTSNSLRFSDGVRAVRRRGEAMQEAVPVGEGAMAAVMGLSAKQVQYLCKWVEETSGFTPLEPANFNSPGQIVVSGRATAVQWLQQNLKTLSVDEMDISNERGVALAEVAKARVKIIPLKVSAPFHCSLMKPAEDVMRGLLEETEFQNSNYPVVQNFVAQPVTSAPTLRENVIRQISAPVRWIECMESLRKQGHRQFIECGSGKVLSGLVKKIDSESLRTFNLNNLEELKEVENLLNASK